MPLPRVIRNAPYLSEGVVIGAPEQELARPIWRMAPPPPPPSVEDELDTFGPAGHDPWASPWDVESGSDQSRGSTAGELELGQKLAELEQTLAEAHAAAAGQIEDARR